MGALVEDSTIGLERGVARSRCTAGEMATGGAGDAKERLTGDAGGGAGFGGATTSMGAHGGSARDGSALALATTPGVSPAGVSVGGVGGSAGGVLAVIPAAAAAVVLALADTATSLSVDAAISKMTGAAEIFGVAASVGFAESSCGGGGGHTASAAPAAVCFAAFATIDNGRDAAAAMDVEGVAGAGPSDDADFTGTLYGGCAAAATTVFVGALALGPRPPAAGADRAVDAFDTIFGEKADGARGCASDGSASPAVARGRDDGARLSAALAADVAADCAGTAMGGTMSLRAAESAAP